MNMGSSAQLDIMYRVEYILKLVNRFQLVFKFKLVYSFKIVSWCDETYPE